MCQRTWGCALKVFHGSLQEVREPDIARSKPFVDFGPAFYVTSYRLQAERWALRRADRSGNLNMAYVSEYYLDEAALSKFSLLRFPEANGECLDFVCNCRKGIASSEQWDAVIGPVANDDVFKTVNKYFKGEYTREETLQQLRYQRQSDQIAFRSPKCLMASLKFIRSYVAEPEVYK